VQAAQQQRRSMLKSYQALITLRNREKALQFGIYEKLECQDQRIIFTRSYAQDRITVIVNFGAKTQVKMPSGAKILIGSARLKRNEFLIYKELK